jgi:hypothetical protein
VAAGEAEVRPALEAELDRISRPGQQGDLAVTVIGGATGVELASNSGLPGAGIVQRSNSAPRSCSLSTFPKA